MTDYSLPIIALEKPAVTLEKTVYYGTIYISFLSVIYLISVHFTGYSWLSVVSVNANSSELALSLIQCFLGILALQLPAVIARIAKINLPDALCIFYYIFVLCGTVLGEMFSLYYRIPIWDSLLHFGSGIMCGMLGAILCANFLKKNNCERLMTPTLIVIAVICFSISIGVFWEIYEFAVDSILKLNMQKYLLENGTALIGRTALIDTMKDLIMCILGTIVAAVSSCISLNQGHGWLSTIIVETTAIEVKKSKHTNPSLKESA